MFKIVVLILVLVFGILLGTPYIFEKYAVWDASDPTDDASQQNSIPYALTPDVAIAIVNQSLDLNTGSYIIDVRTEDEYEDGHIKNALNIPEQTLHEEIPKLIKDKRTVIYLYDTKGHSGATATRLLRSMGYDRSFNIEGGLEGWIKAGLFTVTPNPAYF